MKAAITGASGFIGRRLLDACLMRGHRVSVLSRRSDRSFPPGVDVVRGDLVSEQDALEPLLEGCDVVFNCAGEIRDEKRMKRLHVDGTARLLRAVGAGARQRDRQIHWIQLSSVGAYGPPQGPAHSERIVTEETPVLPRGEYEVTKTLADDLVLEASERGLLRSTIVRPSNVFGAGMPNNSLRALGVMVQKGLFFYIGSPGAVATYVHVDDVIAALIRCAEDERAKDEIFNLSNDCLLADLIDGMARALGVRRPRARVPETLVRAMVGTVGRVVRLPLTPERLDNLVLRTRYPYAKLQKQLGFVPTRAVPEVIGEVVATGP